MGDSSTGMSRYRRTWARFFKSNKSEVYLVTVAPSGYDEKHTFLTEFAPKILSKFQILSTNLVYQDIEINFESLPSNLADGLDFDRDGALFHLWRNRQVDFPKRLGLDLIIKNQ